MFTYRPSPTVIILILLLTTRCGNSGDGPLANFRPPDRVITSPQSGNWIFQLGETVSLDGRLLLAPSDPTDGSSGLIPTQFPVYAIDLLDGQSTQVATPSSHIGRVPINLTGGFFGRRLFALSPDATHFVNGIGMLTGEMKAGGGTAHATALPSADDCDAVTVSFSGDGNSVAGLCNGDTLGLWTTDSAEVSSARFNLNVSIGPEDAPPPFALAAVGASHFRLAIAGKSFRVFDASQADAHGTWVETLSSSASAITLVAMGGESGDQMAVAIGDTHIQMHAATAPFERTHAVETPSWIAGIVALHVSPDGRYLAAEGLSPDSRLAANTGVAVWNTSDGALVLEAEGVTLIQGNTFAGRDTLAARILTDGSQQMIGFWNL